MSSLNLVRLTSNTEKKKEKEKEEEGYPRHTPFDSTWGKFFLPQGVTQEVFHMYPLYTFIQLYIFVG